MHEVETSAVFLAVQIKMALQVDAIKVKNSPAGEIGRQICNCGFVAIYSTLNYVLFNLNL